MNIQQYQQRAQEKHNEHLSILKKLKQKPPKHLDLIMQNIHEEVFHKIDCLQCAHCCKTTGPLFTMKDTERIAKYFKLKPSTFIEKYLRLDEENDYVLQQLPCPFLDNKNYCTIYEHRPKACREFPHTDRKKFYQINHLTIQNCKICPAAFEVVERLRRV